MNNPKKNENVKPNFVAASFEDFKAFNPALTEKMYEHLKDNQTEWKILCGFRANIQFAPEALKRNWALQFINKDIYINRYDQSFYLNRENWKYGN
jgi:hypothetical protein